MYLRFIYINYIVYFVSSRLLALVGRWTLPHKESLSFWSVLLVCAHFCPPISIRGADPAVGLLSKPHFPLQVVSFSGQRLRIGP